MNKKKNVGKQIYFTVFDPNSEKTGFTDIINRWYSIYQLGQLLGYQYVHSPLYCENTPLVFDFLGLNQGFLITIYQLLNLNNFRQKAYNILDKVTFLDYKYSAQNSGKIRLRKIRLALVRLIKYLLKNILFSQDKIVDIPIELNDFKQEYIKSIEDYVDFLDKQIQGVAWGKEKVLIKLYLKLNACKDYYSLLYDHKIDKLEQIDLRSLYFQEREKNPIKSQFTPNTTKLLIHLRLGDTAVIKTPWNTYISVFGSSQIFKEFDQPQNKFYADLIDVEDYFNFVQGLMDFYQQENFSFVVSSDGYTKAFSLIYANQDKLKFSPEKLAKIQQAEVDYEQKFTVFEQFNHSQLLIGENDDNLHSFVHSIFEADIIVAGFRNTLGLIPKLLNVYADNGKPTIILELYKRRKPYDREKMLGLTEDKAILITVDLNNINYQEIVDQINSKLSIELGT